MFHFGDTEILRTHGRLPDGTGRLTPLGSPTLGCENNYAHVDDIIISEFNFNPGEPNATAMAVHPKPR